MSSTYLVNTKIASLALVSFSTLSTLFASYNNIEENINHAGMILDKNINKTANCIRSNAVDSNLKIGTVSLSRGNATKKAFNLFGGYTFLNFGYVAGYSLLKKDEKAAEDVKFGFSDYLRGNIYGDFAFRRFINKKTYFNFGFGLKAGRLLENQRLDKLKQISPTCNFFGGLKFSDVEATIQYDCNQLLNFGEFFETKNALNGLTLNINYKNSKSNTIFKFFNIYIQAGYNNLLTKYRQFNNPKFEKKEDDNDKTGYLLIRYNFKDLFSLFSNSINNFFALEGGIGYNFTEGLFWNLKPSCGYLKSHNLHKIQNAYYMVDELLKENTIEYGLKQVKEINVYGEIMEVEPIAYFSENPTTSQESEVPATVQEGLRNPVL